MCLIYFYLLFLLCVCLLFVVIMFGKKSKKKIIQAIMFENIAFNKYIYIILKLLFYNYLRISQFVVAYVN